MREKPELYIISELKPLIQLESAVALAKFEIIFDLISVFFYCSSLNILFCFPTTVCIPCMKYIFKTQDYKNVQNIFIRNHAFVLQKIKNTFISEN